MWSPKPAEYSRHRCLHIRLHSLIEIQSSRSVLSDSATPWIAACQAFLPFTNSWSLAKFMSIELVMPSNHLILFCPYLLLPSISSSIRVFPLNQLFISGGQSIGASALASVLSMSIQGWFPLRLTGSISLQSKGLSRVFSSTTVQTHQFFSILPSLWSSSHICTWLLQRQ